MSQIQETLQKVLEQKEAVKKERSADDWDFWKDVKTYKEVEKWLLLHFSLGRYREDSVSREGLADGSCSRKMRGFQCLFAFSFTSKLR